MSLRAYLIVAAQLKTLLDPAGWSLAAAQSLAAAADADGTCQSTAEAAITPVLGTMPLRVML